jgi:hypothetical protein
MTPRGQNRRKGAVAFVTAVIRDFAPLMRTVNAGRPRTVEIMLMAGRPDFSAANSAWNRGCDALDVSTSGSPSRRAAMVVEPNLLSFLG